MAESIRPPCESSESNATDSALGKILVIEDDPAFREILRHHLTKAGWKPVSLPTGERAAETVAEIGPAAVLCDVILPGKSGKEILANLHAIYPDLPVVIMTASGTVETAVECMKIGAYDFIAKPFEFERLQTILRNALQFRELKNRVKALEKQLTDKHGFERIVAHTPEMKLVVDQARRAASSDVDVMVLGESGTGKEVIACAIHFNSNRRNGPFVAVNCGAIPEGLLESELFGHEKGSFTGATARRTGCFEQANGGTLFLDEIAEMRPDMQVRLLRALESREIRRVGGDHLFHVNVRVISATNQNIQARLADEKFRSDLYYRLAIFVIQLPPLRRRKEDIGALAARFLKEAANAGQSKAADFSPEALDALARYEWPGNVRELRNAVERAVAFEETATISLKSLPPEIAVISLPVGTPPKDKSLTETDVMPTPPPPAEAVRNATEAADKILTMEEEEKRVVMRALALTGGNISVAARHLKLHRSTLHRKMARFGLVAANDLEPTDTEEAKPEKTRKRPRTLSAGKTPGDS
jgi:DNA-binding NtrC family response regulator